MADDTSTTTLEETKAEAPADASTDAPAAASTDAPAAAAAPAKRKKLKRSVPFGQIHIQASFNNTIITVTDPKGEALTASSSGACGFRGSKKGTAYAAQVAADKAIQAAKQLHGLSKADVYVKGIGLGRDAAIRSLSSNDIAVEVIHDMTGVPHGGVRPKKARRV
jgi:small subunit ribosomal protein S11